LRDHAQKTLSCRTVFLSVGLSSQDYCKVLSTEWLLEAEIFEMMRERHCRAMLSVYHTFNAYWLHVVQGTKWKFLFCVAVCMIRILMDIMQLTMQYLSTY